MFGFHGLQLNKEASLLILGLPAERISILSAERKTPADPAQGWGCREGSLQEDKIADDDDNHNI